MTVTRFNSSNGGELFDADTLLSGLVTMLDFYLIGEGVIAAVSQRAILRVGEFEPETSLSIGNGNKREAKTGFSPPGVVGWYRQSLYGSANQPCQAGPPFHLRETSRNVVRNLPPEGVVQFF
jgi:hypothetical protein